MNEKSLNFNLSPKNSSSFLYNVTRPNLVQEGSDWNEGVRKKNMSWNLPSLNP